MATATRTTEGTMLALPARSLHFPQPTDVLLCDPCYLIEQRQHWLQFIDQLFPPDTAQPGPLEDAGLMLLPTGGLMLYGTTAYGDGFYQVNRCDLPCTGDGLAVDAGMLCAISLDDAHAIGGQRSTAMRTDLAITVHGLQGTLHTDGRGHFWCDEAGLVITTAAGLG